MAKKELKQFRKITFNLTPGQRKKFNGWDAEVLSGYVASDGTDHRRAVLANVGLLNGEVECFLIEAPEARIINRAIMRARKQLK